MITPKLLIDKELALKNIKSMQRKVNNKQGVTLRPHIKTHKNVYFAKFQSELGSSGITCAKLSEAEVMIEGGIRDIFLAYPLLDKEKLKHALELQKHTRRFIYSVDTLAGARLLSEASQQQGVFTEVRLEIETGLARTGFKRAELEMELEEIKKLSGIKITGIYTYRGAKNLSGEVMSDTFMAGAEEAAYMVETAEWLKSKGLKIEDISVGSTPTLEGVLSVPGITEVRPGTYIFNDAMQIAYGVCEPADCAASVVVTVVSKHENRAVIDGGSKSFATDVQPSSGKICMAGFGIVKNHPSICFERMNEEHGVLLLNGDTLEIGEQIEIIPNHVCSTVNLYDFYTFKDGTTDKINARGKVQ